MVIPNATKTNLLTLCSGQGRSRLRLPIYTSPHTPSSISCPVLVQRQSAGYLYHSPILTPILYIRPHTHRPPALILEQRQSAGYLYYSPILTLILYIHSHTLPSPALFVEKGRLQDIYFIHLITYSSINPQNVPATPAVLRQQNQTANDLSAHPPTHTDIPTKR